MARYQRILTAGDLHHARSADHLHAHHGATLAELSRKEPHRAADQHEVEHPLPIIIVWGKWVGPCACGNWPAAHRGWSVAHCYECGAVFRHLIVPPDADAIERALMTRPDRRHRNWRPPETLEDLYAENRAHGVKEGR